MYLAYFSVSALLTKQKIKCHKALFMAQNLYLDFLFLFEETIWTIAYFLPKHNLVFYDRQQKLYNQIERNLSLWRFFLTLERSHLKIVEFVKSIYIKKRRKCTRAQVEYNKFWFENLKILNEIWSYCKVKWLVRHFTQLNKFLDF